MLSELGDLLLIYGTPLLAVGAVIGAIASGIALAKAPRGQRAGPAIVLVLCLIVALGIGTCFGLILYSVGQMGR